MKTKTSASNVQPLSAALQEAVATRDAAIREWSQARANLSTAEAAGALDLGRLREIERAANAVYHHALGAVEGLGYACAIRDGREPVTATPALLWGFSAVNPWIAGALDAVRARLLVWQREREGRTCTRCQGTGDHPERAGAPCVKCGGTGIPR